MKGALMRRNRFCKGFVIAGLLGCAANAGILETITFDTSPLVPLSSDAFSLDLQLNDGSMAGDGNNTAVFSNFNFGSGAPAGLPAVQNGASGSLGSGVTLTDTGFLNEFTQNFMPGNTLSFQLQLSSNVDPGMTTDLFTVGILDNGSEIPTLNSFFDVFVEIDLNSSLPGTQTFGSDIGRTSINLSAPQVTPVTSGVPEPGPFLPVLIGLAGFAAWRFRAGGR